MPQERKLIEEAEVELGRVITPFLDMAFQILFFFVMMYQPSAMEGQMDMALPPTGEGPVDKARLATASSTDATIDLPAEVEVLIRTRDIEQKDQGAEGNTGTIFVKETAREQQVDGIEALRRHLEKIRPTLNNRDAIKVQSDSKVKYGYVILVMDICRQVGFTEVAFSPPPDLQRIIPGQ
jgi:biopolymer transport protein ExbD